MKRLKFIFLGLTVFSMFFAQNVYAQTPSQTDEQVLSYTKYKTVEVLLGYGEYPYSYQYYYSYNDGVYQGTLSFRYLERRPGLGGRNYAWYAVYNGVVSTGWHLLPNQTEDSE